MLTKMPLNFENFQTTRSVLEYLMEANVVACGAGIYALVFTIYGYLALECMALYGGGVAFKAYSAVFAITSAQRTRTLKAVEESLLVASALSDQSLSETKVEKYSLKQDV
ncbi:hypothetical protein NEOLI_003423 [Neolecta irregularis DAH-3]|uniref:Uncharacterized protein n=1 Tax=Neolecta irregularis (strain DAH-3) TaxID=1198029 RepID=A0A1U7LRL1_NEOID|nr:hypothetical protein NEOLI_003423 [Neolecta irregularis DAH-3]|eukprot:OLL25305.1 hypothetical protein NEOLI_003423 [Neolecta irregularis DAH-3]